MTRDAAERVPGWGLVSSLAAPVLLIGGWIWAARLQRDGFDSFEGTISALAAEDADRRWVMTTALLGVGVGHVVTACALGPAPRAARVVLASGGAATIAVALAPLPAGDEGSTAHVVAAGAAFAALALWPAFAGRRTPAWPFGRAVAGTAAAVLGAEVAGLCAVLLADGPRLGLVERVSAGSQAIAPLLAVLISRRLHGRRVGDVPRWPRRAPDPRGRD